MRLQSSRLCDHSIDSEQLHFSALRAHKRLLLPPRCCIHTVTYSRWAAGVTVERKHAKTHKTKPLGCKSPFKSLLAAFFIYFLLISLRAQGVSCWFSVSSRPDPLHQWAERQHPPSGRHAAGAHGEQQLDCGFQSAHHHTPPHDVRQWGERRAANAHGMKRILLNIQITFWK